MAGADLTCMELVEIITDYLEGALPPSEKARFDAHLATCKGCTRYLEQFRATIRLTGKLAEDHIEPGAKNELLTLFRDWKKNRH